MFYFSASFRALLVVLSLTSNKAARFKALDRATGEFRKEDLFKHRFERYQHKGYWII
jgi:hypothetical protein